MELKRCFFASVEKKLVSACRFLIFAIFCVKKSCRQKTGFCQAFVQYYQKK